MAFIILLRIAIGGLALWLLWRLYVTFVASKRPVRSNDQDEWGDVLTAIDKLPETTDPPSRDEAEAAVKPNSPPQPHLDPSDALSKAHLESALLREAERALSVIKKSDEAKRLAAYHELVTYEKLANLSDFEISEITEARLADIHRQAQDIMSPPDRNAPDQESKDADTDS